MGNLEMRTMKKTFAEIMFAGLLLTSCYGDYTMDYEYSGVYAAYQYDLRTFVIGEGMKFDFTVALGGVVENTRDRKVRVVVDPDLLTCDLSTFSATGTAKSFTALDGLKGKAGLGTLSQSYVSKEMAAVSQISPLPVSCYSLEGLENLTIKKGRHTAAVTIRANENLLEDEKAFTPYFAIGFRIEDADADVVVKEKSFEVIAVKCENRFWGNWIHGGRTIVRNDVTSEIISTSEYEADPAQTDDKLYVLSTLDAASVVTNTMQGRDGKLKLTFKGNDIEISSYGQDFTINPIQGWPSRFNDAPLLQDRELTLNYCYSNGDGTTTYVYDILKFRNRIRDGINEWQDENTENYEK